MSMNAQLKSLIRAYAAGQITPEQLAELEALLRSDPQCREQFLRELNVHSALEELAIAAVQRFSKYTPNEPTDSTPVEAGMPTRRADGTRSVPATLGALAMLAVAAALVLGGFLYFGRGEHSDITIVDLHGEVILTGDGGRVVDQLKVGDHFAGGTLESLSADAWVQLEFADDSVATISGRSLLTVSQNGQKQLRLRYGNLSANVTRQASGNPMLVNTPAAQMEVLGTQFDVTTASDSTRLTVNEGLVRMKRLADGEVAEVPAHHQLLATFEPQATMQPTPRPPAQYAWQANLKRDAVFGEWESHADSLARKLKTAVASGVMTEEDAWAEFKAAAIDDAMGSLWAIPWLDSFKKTKISSKPLSLLAIISITRNQPAPIAGHASALLRIEVQVTGSCELQFGLAASNTQGGFAGKYVVTRTVNVSDNAWQSMEFEIPLSELRAQNPVYGETPIDKELMEFWVVATGKSKLRINSVEIIR